MFIQITHLFKNKWHGTPESLIAFSSLSTAATTMFEGLVDLHVFIVKHMFLLVGVLLQSDKTKALVKYLAISSFKFHATYEMTKLLTFFKAHFFIGCSLFLMQLCFCSQPNTCHKDTNTFGQNLSKVLPQWSKTVTCVLSWNTTLFSLQKFYLFLINHMLSIKF